MKFIWTGPVASVSLVIESEGRDVTLHPGGEVDLPETHPWVTAQIARKTLVPSPMGDATQKQVEA